MPCHPSPAARLIVSLPFAARVTLLPLTLATRHTPLTTPALVISTQCPTKYSGRLTVRSVTRVAPVVPACAVPLPSEGSDTSRPLTPALSTISSPYADAPLFRYTVPGPPFTY